MTKPAVQLFLYQNTKVSHLRVSADLKGLRYVEAKTGKTSGSKVTFHNAKLDDMIKFHRPHPEQIMKQCYLREIEQQLRDKGVIK
jgi:hypothetical protein